MTNLITSLLLVVLFSHSLTAVSTPPKPARPVNYVVLLDLSDRLLVPDQARRDAALVQAVFARFEQGVRAQFIINARDRFRVVIAPQRGIRYQTESYMDALYLDLGSLDMGHKRQRLEALRADLPRQLSQLYAVATTGKKQARDFAGCDLWQYANEQLPTDLDPAYNNVLVVLTDGYFDFEHNTHALHEGNRATDARVTDRLRRDANWRQTLTRPTEGLVPIRKKLPNLSVLVAEIKPKYDTLQEADMLVAVWQKWLGEMRVRRAECQLRGSSPKALSGLQRFLH